MKEFKFIPKGNSNISPDLIYNDMYNFLSEHNVNMVVCDGEIDFGCAKKVYYNFEHLNVVSDTRRHFVDILSDSKGLEVWDFSLGNLAFWESKGVAAKYVPLVKSGKIPVDHSWITLDKDIDFLFIGSLSRRREMVLSNLSKLGYSVVYTSNTSKEYQDGLLLRSKVLLNIAWGTHAMEQEQLRIIPALSKGACILSERKGYNYFGDLIFESDYGSFVNKAVTIIEDNLWHHSGETVLTLPEKPILNFVVDFSWMGDLAQRSSKVLGLDKANLLELVIDAYLISRDDLCDTSIRSRLKSILLTPYPNEELTTLEKVIASHRDRFS